MWRLLAPMIFYLLGQPVHPKCPPFNRTHPPEALAHLLQNSGKTLALAGCNVTKIPANASLGPNVEELDLSRNDLQSLPAGFLAHAANVKKLDLSDIGLRELPAQFFAKASRLKELKLEKNALRSVPTGTLHDCLAKLGVDCQCAVAGSVFSYCQNCSATTECHCVTAEGWAENVTNFYAQRCGGMSGAVYAAIVVPIVAVVFLGGLAYFLIRRKQGAAISQDKRGSTASEGVHVQPRYISHTGPQGDGGHGSHAHYENVCVDQRQGAGARQGKCRASKQLTSRLSPEAPDPDIPHGDQPVYANTQDLYYNYSRGATPGNTEDDIYIVPDQ